MYIYIYIFDSQNFSLIGLYIKTTTLFSGFLPFYTRTTTTIFATDSCEFTTLEIRTSVNKINILVSIDLMKLKNN